MLPVNRHTDVKWNRNHIKQKLPLFQSNNDLMSHFVEYKTLNYISDYILVAQGETNISILCTQFYCFLFCIILLRSSNCVFFSNYRELFKQWQSMRSKVKVLVWIIGRKCLLIFSYTLHSKLSASRKNRSIMLLNSKQSFATALDLF